MPEKISRVGLTATGIALCTAALAYIVYFDYRRRNDAGFRRKLRKEKKRIGETVAQQVSQSPVSLPNAIPQGGITPQLLRAAYEQATREDPPAGAVDREQYFMTHIGMGEQLLARGSSFHLTAAISFYMALKVYPSEAELLSIYQKTVPPAVYEIVTSLHSLDTVIRRASYYEYFPPHSMNVQIKTNNNGRGTLVVTEDIPAGKMIYKEYPVVAVLDADLEASGKYCSHCFRSLSPSTPAHKLPQNPLGSTFCSEQCLKDDKAQSTSLLFTQEPPLPPEFGPALSGLDNVARKKAQNNFVEYLKTEKRSQPLLAARFIGRQVMIETNKMVAKVQKTLSGDQQEEIRRTDQNDFTDATSGDYLLAEHMEKLRFLDMQPDGRELPLLAGVLEKTLPGLEQFVTRERYSTLLGKIAYNAVGVGQRDDKPESTARPEDVERTRTPVGTQHQVGSALYTLSSYANHSCIPSATLTFPHNTTELHLIATRDLKRGDEVTVAYVDVSQHDNEKEQETVLEARRRRRLELIRGWRFACACVKCEEEEKGLSQEQKEEERKEVPEGKDESRVERKSDITDVQ